MRLPAIARGITLNNYPIGWSPTKAPADFLYIGIIKFPKKIYRGKQMQNWCILGGILHIFCTNWYFFTKNHYNCKSKIINFIKTLKP